MKEHVNIPAHTPALSHVQSLSEVIGPRGSTSPQEKQAADYAQRMMEEAGLKPSRETFTGGRSAWRPHVLALGLALAAEALFLLGGHLGALLAAGLMILLVASVLLEMTFQGNPLRWVLPKGQSQNIWARIPAIAQPQRRVLLVGHLDTHRTAKMFSSALWVAIFRAIVSANLAAMVFNAIIFIVGYILGMPDVRPWHSLSILPALVIWWFFVLAIEADFNPYTAGANDNATGASVVLSLAARLGKKPLHTVEVWALCSGCKETGNYGITHFLARHRDELLMGGGGKSGNTYCIVLDSIGGSGTGPCYLSQETFLITTPSDSGLLRLADKIATRRPELGAYNMSMLGAYTEGYVTAKAGLRSLMFVNMRKDGNIPHWRQRSDVFANIDEHSLKNTEAFVWEMLQALDESHLPSTPYQDIVPLSTQLPPGNEISSDKKDSAGQ